MRLIIIVMAGKGNTAEILVFYSGDIYVTSFALNKLLFYEK